MNDDFQLRQQISRMTGIPVENVILTDEMPEGVGMIVGDFTQFADTEDEPA